MGVHKMTMRKATSKKYNLKKRGKTHKNKNLKKRTKKRVLKRKKRSTRRKTKKGGQNDSVYPADERDAPLPPLPITPIIFGSDGQEIGTEGLYKALERKNPPPLPPKSNLHNPESSIPKRQGAFKLK
jgi:hypothetical protein